MASGTPEQETTQEPTCPICLKYFTKPVSVDCGHNFCRDCITRYCEEWTKGDYGPLCCSVCRARIRTGNHRPNRDLAHIIEKIQEEGLKAGEAGKETVCARHKEKLNLFCEKHGEAVCVVCEKSPEHRSHPVLLLEVAAWKYKMEIVRWQNETVTKLDKEISHLSELIGEMEGKDQQPAREFLQVRLIERHLRSLPREGLALGQSIQGSRTRPVPCPKQVIGHHQGTALCPAVCEALAMSPMCRQHASDLNSRPGQKSGNVPARMGLLGSVRNRPNPDTVYPGLVLSEDRKSVQCGDTRQDLPDNPERFDPVPCVLGCKGFTSGRHCWDVEVGDGGRWAVGVARESLRRKGVIDFNPGGGIWAVERCLDQYQALTSPESPLSLSRNPRRIRVSLDYEAGQVAFCYADNEAPIFTFPPASFAGDRICPWGGINNLHRV
uniref:Uncharacterized protein n=1 Tax=Chelydra serpentina TaxID=8475 RepID=A0A8C3T0B3_CHESE